MDHVIPWARYPNNAIENLMVANERCKGRKRNFLAAPEHQGRWRERFGRNPLTALELEHVAEAADWEVAPGRSATVTQAIYLRLPADAQLWNRGQEFVEDEPQEL